MFKEALPVWQKGKEKEMNYSMLFKTVILCNENSGKRYVVRIAASTVYQLFINGKFITTGPAVPLMGIIVLMKLILQRIWI